MSKLLDILAIILVVVMAISDSLVITIITTLLMLAYLSFKWREHQPRGTDSLIGQAEQLAEKNNTGGARWPF